MPFSFGAETFPLSLKATRSLLYVEVVLFIYGAFLFVIFGAMSAGTSVSGISLATEGGNADLLLAGVCGAMAAAIVYLAIALGRPREWTRLAIVAIQVGIVVLSLLRAGSNPVSLVIMIAICAGIVYSLYSPSARLAFAGNAERPTAAESTTTVEPTIKSSPDAFVVDPPPPPPDTTIAPKRKPGAQRKPRQPKATPTSPENPSETPAE